MYEILPALILVLDGLGQAILPCNFVPDGRSPAFLILCIGRKRTSCPFTRLRIGQTKSNLLDSTYQTGEDKPSFLVISYQTDEVQPA